MTVKLPPTPKQNYINDFVENLTRHSLEERIVEVLTRDIPEIWRREFSDVNENDLPDGLLTLIAELEHWCHVDFGEDE